MKALLIVFFLFPSCGLTESLSDSGYLNKLSRTIRGVPPSLSEKHVLRTIESGTRRELYFLEKIDEYLASELHFRKMTFRLEELFLLKTNQYSQNKRSDQLGYYQGSMLNQLFIHINRQNISWHTLLTGDKYTLFPNTWTVFQNVVMDDFGFMGMVAANIAKTGIGVNRNPGEFLFGISPVSVDLQQHQQIAGAITTNRFFGRYSNTAINKNRKRAAAVFRIFLCDSMTAAVPTPSENIEPILDKVFPQSLNFSKEELHFASESQHGNQADCRRCHYKLDPMGRIFSSSSMVLSKTPVNGALVFTNKKGVVVNKKVRGFRELAQAITEQNEYKLCQFDHFWKWFVGNDKSAPESLKLSLINEFDRDNWRPKSIIKKLVTSDEFREKVGPAPPAFAKTQAVKAVFKRCDACHATQEIDVAVLSQWPIGGSLAESQDWISEIAEVLDFHRNGKKRSMPPQDSDWQLSFDQFALLKNWFDQGAPDEMGRSMRGAR